MQQQRLVFKRNWNNEHERWIDAREEWDAYGRKREGEMVRELGAGDRKITVGFEVSLQEGFFGKCHLFQLCHPIPNTRHPPLLQDGR